MHFSLLTEKVQGKIAGEKKNLICLSVSSLFLLLHSFITFSQKKFLI